MVVAGNVLHMNTGEGETSYARNSNLQKSVIATTRAVVEDTIKDMISRSSFPNCYTIADLGCGSGPNTFFAISNVIVAILDLSREMKQEPPHEFQVFLNDLAGNDFNSIFKYTPEFYQKLQGEKNSAGRSCFVSGVPGSFHGRLFPSSSLYLVHASSCLHWLTRTPPELGLEGNKGSIYISKRSPPSVHLAYLKQFERDFFGFLSSRKDELVPGGRMVFVMTCHNSADPCSNFQCESIQLLADALLEMAAEGLVKKADIDSFNVPYYSPSKEEVGRVIQEEGSFDVFRSETILVEPNDVIQSPGLDKDTRAHAMALHARAIFEPLFVHHFGDAIIDEFFTRCAKHLAEHPSILDVSHTHLIVSLTKKK